MATARKTTTGGAAGGKSRKPPARKTPAQPTGIRRELWAILYAVLAIIAFLCLFGFDGFVLKWLKTGLGALFGVGFYAVPFALAGLCVLLLVQRKGPVRVRGIGIALLPVLIGGIAHSILCANQFPLAMRTFADLIKTGGNASSGGLLGGLLYILLEWAISSVGAFLVLLLMLIADLMVACKLTPVAVWHMLKTPAYEYDSDEEREKYEAPTTLPNVHVVLREQEQKRASRRAASIDIPLDDTPVGAAKKAPPPPDEYLKNVEPVPTAETAYDDVLSLMDEPAQQSLQDPVRVPDSSQSDSTQAPWEDLKPRKKDTAQAAKAAIDAENEAIAAAMSANQQAPVPAYAYPAISLLVEPQPVSAVGTKAELAESSQRLLDTLSSFGIDAIIINIVRGPSVTRFELTIERGVKFSRVTALSDDIALSLGAMSVRIAAIPDKIAIGIEVPNKITSMVFIREVIGSRTFQAAQSRTSFAVGKDITGLSVVGDIAKMPHMLIAGTTGSGKSVCINSMLISLLYKSTPEEVRLIMVDPKMVELGNYNGVPHLLIPVVTDPQKASGALNWAVGEMERRYKVFAENQVRNLVGYNDVMRRKQAEAEENPEVYIVLPQIVIVIDELADLMMVAAKEVETSICRLAQKARAAGMHLIVATQRPSADVITGIMKANIPSRIAFAVASQIESRIILDQTGAEKLIGKGDMLYAPLGEGKPTRVQGCYIGNDEIEAVIAKVKEGQVAEYSEEILEHIERQSEKGGSGSGSSPSDDDDEMLPDAIEIVVTSGQASTSMLQRRLKLGYARAARIVDQMQERGIVGASEGAKPRAILITREEWQEMKLRQNMR